METKDIYKVHRTVNNTVIVKVTSALSIVYMYTFVNLLSVISKLRFSIFTFKSSLKKGVGKKY